MIVPCAKLHAAYNAIARRSRALPARPGAMAKPAGALNRMAAGNRIAELIGRYGLLHEGRKIGNPAGTPKSSMRAPSCQISLLSLLSSPARWIYRPREP